MLNAKLFMSALLPGGNAYLTSGHAELFRQILEQVFIGFAIDRRGGDAHLEAAAMRTDNFVPAGAWLEINA